MRAAHQQLTFTPLIPHCSHSYNPHLYYIHKGRHELGEGDEPLNSWAFGEQGELFRYRLVGQHRVQSGERGSGHVDIGQAP